MTMTTTSILSATIDATTTDKTLATMFRDASERAVHGAQAMEYVVWAAVRKAGRKQTAIADILPVGKSQVNNYVAHVDMWEDLGMLPESITAAWNVTTGSRGWFSKRSTDAYKALRDQVRATDDQARKVALLTGTDVPETPEKVQTVEDAIRMLTAARDLLRTLDVKASDQAIIATLTGEIDAAVVAPAQVPVAA